MGYSGLIYAAIVAAWAAFLVPRWVRRNEEVERAREADVERGVRVLSRRGGRPPQASHGAVTLPTAPGAAVSAGQGGSPVPSSPVDDVFAVAARRRRRMLGMLLVLLVASVALVVLGRAPAWAPFGPGVLLVLFVLVARRAAVAQARRRRAEARRAAAQRRRSVAREASAVWASPSESEEGATRRLVLPDELVEPASSVGEGEEWSPVPVPLPTYLTKPKATRPAARKIDLSQPGAWTSGRLDPASSIQLPRRDPDERPAAASSSPAPEETTGTEDVVEERRRAVGD
ncbi:divisome protein SepX/GlpR [Jiangella rhizosphaerae]|uniref:Uncharacterized protein n=1 Tax=Jiangella rhizosphaerae TaxID=2293569 RepID=A0A418KM69_9ACTN|nr:hypothetical protein [Jiangella rhizosphaerae]RIQ19461.1 hypothetical protein DY240_19860 [Jiangella rhizosphaerae]